MLHVLATGKPKFNLEIVGETPAQPGLQRSWLEHWLPIRDGHGIVKGMSIVVEETTERRKAEEDLRESEEKFSKAFYSSPFFLFISELETGIFIDVNYAYCKMLGYSREEMIGRSSLELGIISADKRTEIVEQFHIVGKLEKLELQIAKRSGETRSCIFSAESMEYLGKQCLIYSGIDITERKQAEEQLRKLNETLEARVAERTQLAESRTKQLHALAMEVIEAEERERRRIATLLHEDLQQMLASARFQVQSVTSDMHNESMLEDVSQILEESIAKSRRLSHELSPPVLHHNDLHAVFEWLATQMGEKFGIQVQLEANGHSQFENGPVKVFLFRAVQELLFNAVKHGGVKTVRVQLSESKGDLAITVSDQGKGFDPAILDLSEAKTGIGLLGIRERARHVGGNLKIESAPGEGSRFCLKVPVTFASQEKIQKPATPPLKEVDLPAASDAKRLRLLIVDDHKVMRQGLISLISGNQLIEIVGEAADGHEAVKLAKQLRPDVIIMDISMPVMDGIEATRHIKTAQSEVHVIGLSVHEDEKILKGLRDAGADGFLSKSASAAELLEAIYKGGRFTKNDQ